MANAIEFRMPWPATLGKYYRCVHGRIVISKAGRLYREKVIKLVKEGGLDFGIDKPIALSIGLAPPTGIKIFDLDNFNKSLWDALTHAGVWKDDSLIYELQIRKLKPYALGEAYITIWDYEDKL